MTEIKSFIQGVEIIKKNQIVDDRGVILHMLRVDDKNYKKFGEIYFYIFLFLFFKKMFKFFSWLMPSADCMSFILKL